MSYGPKQREANKAKYIRAKMRDRKPVTTEQKTWLKSYEIRTGSSASASANDASSKVTAVPSTTPVLGTSVAGAERATMPNYEPPPINLNWPSEPSSMPPSAPSDETKVPPPKRGPTDEERAKGNAIAEAFILYLRRCNLELAQFPGAVQLPDIVLDGLVAPCARELAVKYAGDVELSDTVKGLVVLGGAAATLGQLEYRKAQERKKDEGAIDVQGARVIDVTPSQAPPTNGNSAHPYTPPSARPRARDDRFTGGPGMPMGPK